MGTSKVAILKTSPETVVEDYGRLMDMAGYIETIRPDNDVILKINISWHKFYPACSTAPWQLEGVIRKLLADGFTRGRIIGGHNRTVVVSDRVGEVANKQKPVTDKYGIRCIHLNESPTEWVRYEAKKPFLVLDGIFPDGVKIPKTFIGKSIIQMPLMKTHVFTKITGAMKNAFGGLLSQRRHWTHSVIHETLVDLLTIQQDIHPGIFAVMDGTAAGDGPGPRCMKWYIKNYLLASADQVAIDAVSAKLMGFDPLSIKFIALAHEKGLGCGDPRDIDIVGEDISDVNFHFVGPYEKMTLASRGQKMIYHGKLKGVEHLLLRTAVVPWSFAASRLYHDVYWYPCFGRSRVADYMKTEWGKLFQSY